MSSVPENQQSKKATRIAELKAHYELNKDKYIELAGVPEKETTKPTITPTPKTVPGVYTVYGLKCTCHPESGIQYVGLTTAPISTRLRAHRSTARSGKLYPVCTWIRLHGPYSIEAQVLYTTTDVEDLQKSERFWIEHYKSENPNLLNVMPGGELQNLPGTKFKQWKG